MPRHIHPDDGMVFACPDCDNAPVYRRKCDGGRNAEHGDEGDTFACYDCGWSGPEPTERESNWDPKAAAMKAGGADPGVDL